MQKNKGFTLIELLVVIAIIGLLSSIVLASLKTARDKANEASVKQALTTIRTQAEIIRSKTGKYQIGTGIGYSDECIDPGGGTGSFMTDPVILKAATQAAKATKKPGVIGDYMVCWVSDNFFVVAFGYTAGTQCVSDKNLVQKTIYAVDELQTINGEPICQ